MTDDDDNDDTGPIPRPVSLGPMHTPHTHTSQVHTPRHFTHPEDTQAIPEPPYPVPLFNKEEQTAWDQKWMFAGKHSHSRWRQPQSQPQPGTVQDGYAIAAFIFALYPAGSILAVILATVHRHKAQKQQRRPSGLSTAAMILGWLGIIIIIAFLLGIESNRIKHGN